LSTKSLIAAEGSKFRTRVGQLSKKLEKGFTVLVLLLSTQALLPLLREEGVIVTNTTYEASPVTMVIWVGVYIVIFSLVAVRWKRFMYDARRNKLLLLLVGLALVSVLWSASPKDTLLQSFALVGTTLIGIYLAMRYSLGEQLRLLAWTLGIAALLSLVFALASPSYGISIGEHVEGAWRGIFMHKNTLGRLMALSLLVFLLLGMSGHRYHRVACLIFFVLSVGLIMLSDSRTALISSLILLILLLFYNTLLQWNYTLSVPALIGVVLLGGGIAALLLYNIEFVLGVFGRNATLTGRTDLWAAVFEMIRESPWLGYGYGAFWLGWMGESAYIWNTIRFWQPESAHNGFLDLWLDLGLAGILVFILGFLMSSLRAIVWARLTSPKENYWPMIYLTFMVLFNLPESTLLFPNTIFWILYVAIAVSLSNIPLSMASTIFVPKFFK
jgi:exopolysaccharide production protein ExoQ